MSKQMNKRRKLRKGVFGDLLLILLIVTEIAVAIYIGITILCNNDDSPSSSNDTSIVKEENEEPVTTTTEQIPKATIPFEKHDVEIYKISNETPVLEINKLEEINYTEDYYEDLNLLAGLIEAEGGIASEITRKRIGIAALNRITSNLFPNTLYEVISQSGQYETYMRGLIPEYASEENISIAKELLKEYYGNNWAKYCRSLLLSEKVVYQANSEVNQSEYSYTTLDEYGVIGNYEYHMVYGESIYDCSDMPYNVQYMY